MIHPPCILQQVSPHVYWYTPDSVTDRPSLALVVGEKMSLMLDIGASPKHSREFLAAVQAEGLAAPSFAIATHWHWDHWFGIDALTMPVLAFRETAENMRRQMRYDFSDKGLAEQVVQGLEIAFCTEHMAIEMNEIERRNLRLRMPDIIFEGRFDFDLGGVSCHVEHVGGDHASDACVMFIPEDGLLFTGDCLYPNIYQEPYNYRRENLLPLIAKIESYGAKQYLEGHSPEIIQQETVQQWFAWIRLANELIEKYGLDEAKLSEAMPKDEDALDFLRDMLAGEKLKS